MLSSRCWFCVPSPRARRFAILVLGKGYPERTPGTVGLAGGIQVQRRSRHHSPLWGGYPAGSGPQQWREEVALLRSMTGTVARVSSVSLPYRARYRQRHLGACAFQRCVLCPQAGLQGRSRAKTVELAGRGFAQVVVDLAVIQGGPVRPAASEPYLWAWAAVAARAVAASTKQVR